MDKQKMLKQATAIRDAHMIAENTAVRVGSLFVDIVNALSDGDFLSRIKEDSALKRIYFLAGLTMMGGSVASADGSKSIDFEYDTVHDALHFKGNVYADGFISAKGMADGGAGDDGSGGTSYDRYDGDWSDYTPVFDPWVVSGKSGKALLDRIKALESGGVKPGDIPTLHTLTIKLNGATVGTFNPSADKTINIADVASASALSAHVSDATVHVTATERAKWNKVVTDFAAITGTDADTVINKWEEVVAFLDSYTEADTLAGLLSHKADKATTLAGYGITDAYTMAQTDTKLSHKLDKSVFDTFKSEFDSMFVKESDGNGGWRIKTKYGLYSVSFITAKGINGTQEGDGSGEGGASYDRLDAWADYTAERAGDVLSAKLGWDLHTRLGNCYAKTEADSLFQPKGDYLTQHQSLTHLLRIDGANGTWAGVSALIGKLSDATSVIEDATLLVTSHVDPSSTSMFYRRPASALWDYVKSKADALYQHKGNYLTTDGYPSVLDGRYVNTTGDTMTGTLFVRTGTPTQVRVDNAKDGGIESGISFGLKSVNKGWVGYNSANGVVLYNYANGCYLGIKDNGTPHFNSHKIWHAGNDGSGSGLDADLLDGVHESALFRSNRGDIPTEFIDLASYNPNAEGYANYSSGTYRISRSGYSDLFINFALNTGSASALQIKTSYDDNASLQFRKTIDSNRVSGAWRTILTELNIGNFNAGSATKLADNTAYTAWGRTFFENGKPKSVSGDMAGVGSLSASGEIRTTAATAFRAVRGGYGFLVRNDGERTFFLFTGKGNELGGWNGLRPLYINNATGRVTMGNGLSVGEAVVTTLKIGPVTISYDSANEALKISGGGLYSESFITAKGVSSTSQGSDGGGSDFGLMKTWPTADPGIGTMDALGANLGWQLYTKASANASSISSLSSRITALEGKNYLDALTLAQSGTGNAVTSVSLSADKKTLTVVKGATFALSSDLTWGNITGKPTNFVTTNTNQTITGAKTFEYAYIKMVGSNKSTAAHRHSPGVLSFAEGRWNDQFGIWADFGDTYTSQNLYIGGSGTGTSLDPSENGDNFVPYLTINHTTGNLTVLGKIIRSGGTASQFLMADGSVTGKASASTVSSLGWSDRAVDGLRIPDMNMLAFWNGAYAGTSSNLAYCDRGRFGDIVTHAHSEYVTALGTSGDFLTWTRNGAVNKITVPFASNADMLDGKHLGNTAGYVVQWTSFPTFASLVTQGYLAEAVKNDNREYFKALLKWICANYTGEVQLIGRATPSSQGMLTIHIYDCDNVQDGLPEHSSAVYEAYMGSVTAFGTASYKWRWNHGTWNGTASTATRLKDSYSLWGQSFYGNDVKGNIASDHFMLNDAAGNPYLRLTKDSFVWYVQAYDTKIYLGAGIYRSLSIDKDGKVAVGYGTTNPAYALDVNGDIRAMGWLRFGTWGRMGYDNGGWLQMAPSVTNRITAMNAAEMTRLEIKSAVTAFSGQITNANSAGNSTTIAYGAIELSHATPYIDFHFGRSAADFDVRLVNDEAGVLHLVGGSLKLGNGYIRWDSTRGCFALSHGLYSESFITAKKTGDTTASGTANVEPGGTVEVGGDPVKDSGAVKVQSDEPEQEDTELEALRLRVAQLEQRINALTA